MVCFFECSIIVFSFSFVCKMVMTEMSARFLSTGARLNGMYCARFPAVWRLSYCDDCLLYLTFFTDAYVCAVVKWFGNDRNEGLLVLAILS